MAITSSSKCPQYQQPARYMSNPQLITSRKNPIVSCSHSTIRGVIHQTNKDQTIDNHAVTTLLIHTYIHTYIHTHIRYVRMYIHTYIHTYVRTYTCMHAYSSNRTHPCKQNRQLLSNYLFTYSQIGQQAINTLLMDAYRLATWQHSQLPWLPLTSWGYPCI